MTEERRRPTEKADPILYAKVRDTLAQRLVGGAWAAGEALPSETELAAQTGVSRAVVRKALDALAADFLVVRAEGGGGFVAGNDGSRVMHQFFNIAADSGEATYPDSRVVSVRPCQALAAESLALGVAPGADIVRIHRVRRLGDRPTIAERIVSPAALFPGLLDTTIPNNLCDLYARRYGVTVTRAHEKLKAIELPAEEALLLETEAGTPCLAIERTAYGLDDAVVEWRRSFCLTKDHHYRADLT